MHFINQNPIRLHAWGSTLEETFEQCAVAMFDYISELQYCDVSSLDMDVRC